MKLIFAIIRYDNEDEVVNALTQKRFSITKLSSTGGFLRKGNTTLMIGTEEERVKEAIETIKKECGARQKITINMPYIRLLAFRYEQSPYSSVTGITSLSMCGNGYCAVMQ